MRYCICPYCGRALGHIDTAVDTTVITATITFECGGCGKRTTIFTPDGE